MSDRNWRKWRDKVGFEDAADGFVTLSDTGVKRVRKANDGTASNRVWMNFGVASGDIIEVSVMARLLEGDPDSESCPRIGIDYPDTGLLQTSVKITSHHWRRYDVSFVVPDDANPRASVTVSLGVWTDLIGDVEFTRPRVEIVNEESHKTLGLGLTYSDIFTFQSYADYIKPAGFTGLLGNTSMGLPESGKYFHFVSMGVRRDDGGSFSLAAEYRGDALYLGTNNTQGAPFRWKRLVTGGADTGWLTPTLIGGWREYGAGYDAVQYRKDALGFVHLKGLVRAFTGWETVDLFSLPEGFRPAGKQAFATLCDNGSSDVNTGRLDVDSNGIVSTGSGPWKTDPTNVRWISLSGISFHAED